MRYLQPYKIFENIIEDISSTKVCSKCGEEKEIDLFYNMGSKKRPECKLCSSLSAKKYRKNNPESIKELKRKYHQSERGKKTNREYYVKYRKNIPEHVRDKLNQSHKSWCHNQYNTNSRYKLIVSIRNLIGKSFKYKNKPLRTEQILGCSIDDFRIYIENQFLDGMSWDNQGKWHLDHIEPISWAKTEEDIIRLNHYTNFKPMCGIDNIRKKNKFKG